ncbi:phosphoribosylglycinamide formyltransferase [bacterium]|nr:phosphoribosylglycinamide formyltransferase [bacterium]
MDSNNFAVFISGRGSNLFSILKKEREEKIRGKVSFVYSNRRSAPGLAIAQQFNKDYYTFPYNDENEKRLLDKLKRNRVKLIVLAGFMKVLSHEFIERFKGHIINIHPSLLPAFPGLNAQEQSFNYGSKISGLSIHFVDTSLDGGPVIFQKAVDISDLTHIEDIEKRILVYEHRYYYQIIDKLLNEKWELKGRNFFWNE